MSAPGSEVAHTEPVPQLPSAGRLRAAVRRPSNWMELVRFGAVGASGYVVNLGVFAAAVHAGGIDYRIAAVLAFLVAVANNFFWNRHWTFDARDGHAGFQAARFFVVSVGAFLVSLAVLELMVVVADAPEVLAQAVAIVVATPFNFVGNKLWSFRR
ncbi:GtrA family protein [Paraconexibacter algicola]|uniref:GtrA family protein n=1 Tax=Paraconexibacter algicola TaxID=2133960 RepID=A0A2T4UJ68_9ACTN|nr:GtrA family protein [Paraconexibacter algicola]PTL59247.1 GtrA family protein [Paraconexibacter algicola]